jgi:putative tricarboxylic transport membrane protein
VRANDAIAGFFLILLAGTMIALTASFPAFPGQKYGPSLFPRVLGTAMILCGALLAWRGLAARRGGQSFVELEAWTRQPRGAVSFALILGSIVLYIVASEAVGFIPIAVLILGSLFLWFGVRWFVALPLALAATWIMHWFFASTMRVPLPRGWLNAVL